MGCELSLLPSLEFSNFEGEEICSFSDVNQIPDDKFQLHFDKVKTLCQNKNFLQAQKIGDKFFSKHAILQAIQVYQHILENDPKYGLQELQGHGNTELAMSLYMENVWKFYDNQNIKSVYDALSLCYMILTYSPKEFLKPLSKGQAWYKKIIQKQPNNIGLLIGCGNIYCNQDKVDEALEYYEEATKIYEGFMNIYVLQAMTYRFKKSNKQKSIEFSNKVLRMTNDNQYAELVLATYIDSVDERIQKLEELHQKYPTYNRILMEKGGDYSDFRNNPAKEIECYQKSIKTNPLFYKGYNNLGHCYKLQENYQKAIECFFKAIEINKQFNASYSGLLVSFEKKGMNDEDISKQLENHPKVRKDWFWMKFAQIVDTNRPKETDRAISYYTKATEVNPNFYLGYYTFARFYYNQKKNDQAIANYKKCFETNPEFYYAHFSLAMLYAEQGYEEEAIKMYQKAIELNPRFSYAFHNLANIYSLKKDYEKAEIYYESAVKFEAKDSIILTNLAVCYLDQKKYKEAHEAFLKAKKYLERTKRIWEKERMQGVEKSLKNADIDNEQKWNVYIKSGSISQEQKARLQNIMNEFTNKLKIHEKINPNIKMPLERVMHPDVFEITKIIYEYHFGLFGLPKAFTHIMKLYCEVDEDYFHIVPLFIVQYFLLNVYERKRGPQDVENQCQEYMKQVAAMVAAKQKEVNEGAANQNKENQQAAVNLKNIKIELTECKPLNKQINLFKEAAFFNTYEDVYAQIDKANNAAKPSYNDFALLVEQVRTRAKGIPGGISMKIPSKSEDQFKVIMRIMEKMFKKQIDPERVRKTIFNIESRIVHSKYDQNLINEQIVDAWNYQITKILRERKEKNIQTQCFVSDLIRAKCTFNTVEDLANAVKVADQYCKTHGYQIVELDNRLAKPQTKDVVLKIQIRDAVCEFQLAMPQSAKLFHLDHCVYEIIRSPLGCIFGSYLFISKSVKYPLAKNCEDMFMQLSKSQDMMDKINRMYPQYVRNTLIKQWKIQR